MSSDHDLQDYKIKKLISKGTYLKTFEAEHQFLSRTVAIKFIEKDEANPSFKHFKNEIQILPNIHHPFIAECFQIIERGNKYFLVIEYAENGSLLEYIQKKGKLSEHEAKRLFMQLVTVLQYLHHDAMVAHRDLKLENILLDKYNNIKLIDFGFSKSFAESHQFTSLIGSPAYVSPEIITRKTYSEKTDIWSLGIILYVMTTGTFPFNGTTTQMQMQRIAFVDPFIPHYLSHELRVLLKGMLTKDFTNRITLDEILDSKWLQGYKESSEAVTKLHNNLTNGIDKQIVEYMKSLSLDCEQLNENWINVTNSKVVAIYKIILCSKISRIVATELNKHKENNAQIQKHNFRSLTSYNRENREINDEQQQCVKVSKQGFLGKAKI